MRTVPSCATKGSQYWLQILINSVPDMLDQELDLGKITWRSPLRSKNYAEYSDADFLNKLNLSTLVQELDDFWPKGGPHWDGLGKAEDNAVIILEAKANIPEIFSACKANDPNSIRKIEDAINHTRCSLFNHKEESACYQCIWITQFYQYANRLAHLHFLRQKGINAFLVFLYFLNDKTHLPTSQDMWDGALEVQKRVMGISGNTDGGHIKEVFIDTELIKLVKRHCNHSVNTSASKD